MAVRLTLWILAVQAIAASAMKTRAADAPVDVYALRTQVINSQVVKDKIAKSCHGKKIENCEGKVADTLFCQLLTRSQPDLAAQHCDGAAKKPASDSAALVSDKQQGAFAALKAKITSGATFQKSAEGLAQTMGCNFVKKSTSCENYVKEAAFCLAFAEKMDQFAGMSGSQEEKKYCSNIDQKLPALSMVQRPPRHTAQKLMFLQMKQKAPEDDLAKEMTHDLEMNFNKIAPFGKEDTAKELQDHAAKTQDTLVDAVENAEVAEIKRAVFRALTRLRAATIKEFDTIARLETQAIDAYNDAHHYRAENPLAHLHEDEAPVETDKLKSFH